MSEKLHLHLSKRESQIMDCLYALGEATVEQVLEHLGNPTSYNSLRVTLRVLEKKGHVRHRDEGGRFVYSTVVPVEVAKRSVLRHMLATFFGGSPSRAMAALVDSADGMSVEELDEMAALVERTRAATTQSEDETPETEGGEA